MLWAENFFLPEKSKVRLKITWSTSVFLPSDFYQHKFCFSTFESKKCAERRTLLKTILLSYAENVHWYMIDTEQLILRITIFLNNKLDLIIITIKLLILKTLILLLFMLFLLLLFLNRIVYKGRLGRLHCFVRSGEPHES